MNKNTFYLALFAVLCVLAGVVAGAGITKWVDRPRHDHARSEFRQRAERLMGHGREYGGKHGGLLEMFTAKLDLNADQKAQVADILEKTRRDIDEVGKNVRSSIKEIKENGDKQIMAILTPEQQEKFKALEEKFKKSRRGMRGPEKAEGER